MKLIGRIVCLFKGHRRGAFSYVDKLGNPSGQFNVYACPRCDRETRYKMKPHKPHPGNNGAPSDDQHQARCSTWDEAEKMHDVACKLAFGESK